MVVNTRQISNAERERLYGSKIVAENVSYEDYLAEKYGRFVEWIDGVVIENAPREIWHQRLAYPVEIMCRIYTERTDGGTVLCIPFVMRAAPYLPARTPDIQVILPDRMHYIKVNEVAGPANLVIEIVSPESSKRDRGDKHDEYEQGGVQEYWILDPQRRETLFYVRGEDELFHLKLPMDGVYTSTVLPKLKLKVDILWQANLPTTIEIIQMVEQMLKDN